MAYTKHGRVTSTIPGIPTRFTTENKPASRVLIQALRDNTGFVAVGGANVRVRNGEQNSASLAVPATSTPQMREITNVNLSDLYLDVTVANEGIAYDYE